MKNKTSKIKMIALPVKCDNNDDQRIIDALNRYMQARKIRTVTEALRSILRELD